MLTISNTKESTQVRLARFNETGEMIRELARIIFPNAKEFRSVWEITNQVFDHYYQAKAA